MKKQPHTAILLAAGRGKRLRPYTFHTPKPLLPVNGRPILDFVLTAVAKAGIETVCLVTHYLAEQIVEFVGDGAAWGVTAVTCRQSEMLGTAHALQTAVTAYPELFVGQRPFLLTATDYILSPEHITTLVNAHVHNDATITASLKQMSLAEVIGRSSTAFDSAGYITKIVEKPLIDAIPSLFVASLIFLLPADILNYLPQMTPSTRGEFEIQAIINQMIQDGYKARGVVQASPAEWDVGEGK